MPDYRFPPGLHHNVLVYFFGRFRANDPIHFFQHLAETYGPITYYRLGPENIVFINDPDLIKEVLINQHANFTKERTQQRMKILVGEGLITSEGKKHQKNRHLAQPAFHRQRIAGYAETMVERAVRWRELWKTMAPGPLDIAQEMMHLALSVVGKTLFGSENDDEARGVAAEVNAIMKMYNFLVALPKAEYFLDYPLPGIRRFRKARTHLDTIVYRMIAEHRAAGTDRGDLLSMLLSARDENGEPLSDEQLRDEIMTIFLAGYETTANALTWTWYLLSQNPEAEAKLHAEIDSVLGSRLPSIDDLPQLTYVEKVVSESMRVYPPAWAMGRKAIADFALGDYYFPGRTSVFMSQYVMHRHPTYFPDPERFDPDRFAPETKAARPRFAYFPFGGGKRQCIGESFAWTELILVIATIAQRWKLRLVPGHPVAPQPLITLRPRHGMQMTLESRV